MAVVGSLHANHVFRHALQIPNVVRETVAELSAALVLLRGQIVMEQTVIAQQHESIITNHVIQLSLKGASYEALVETNFQ